MKEKSIVFATCSLLLAFAISWLAAAQEKVQFGQVSIQLADKKLTVEYAKTWQQRQQGLMFRQSLCEDCGMLFEFEQPRVASMWMKNTLIPLDVAYIRKDGVIIDIKALKPGDLTPVSSSAKVSFALEMNQGWFAQNQIKVGAKLKMLPGSKQ